MKKFLQALGLIFAVLLIGLVVLTLRGNALDRESKAYVDDVIPKILADLRKETLLVYASEDLKNAVKPEELDKLFTWLQKLGAFRTYNGAQGQATIAVTTQAGKVITGQYVAQAEFDTGPAQVQIGTIKKGDQWFIQRFHLNSKALIGG